MKDSIVANRSFDFAISIISLYKKMVSVNEYVLSKQLLRSATGIGANIQEALDGQSKKDFIHKMSIANREARETKYWLMLLDKSQLVKEDYSACLNELEQLINMLTSIMKTAQINSQLKTQNWQL
jgi:four helix bundle protein